MGRRPKEKPEGKSVGEFTNIQIEYPKRFNRLGAGIAKKIEKRLKEIDTPPIKQEIPSSDIENFIALGYTFEDAKMVYQSYGFDDLEKTADGKYIATISVENALRTFEEMSSNEQTFGSKMND